jgi:hypothetical protein
MTSIRLYDNEEDELDDDELDLDDLIGAEEGDELSDILNLIEGVDDEDDDDDDDIEGEDEDDEVGARRSARARIARLRRRMRRKRKKRPTQIVKPTIVRPAIVRERRAAARRVGRVLLLGGRATQGPTAGQLLIPTTVQELARVDRLFVSGRDETGTPLDPSSYSIADIKVGTKSQFAALPPLPGIMFQADATGQGVHLGLDAIQTGTDFTVIIADAPPNSMFTWGAYATALRG